MCLMESMLPLDDINCPQGKSGQSFTLTTHEQSVYLFFPDDTFLLRKTLFFLQKKTATLVLFVLLHEQEVLKGTCHRRVLL